MTTPPAYPPVPPMPDPPPQDRWRRDEEYKNAALYIIRAMEPLAVQAVFETTDQNYTEGFRLVDLVMPGDSDGPGIAESRLEEINSLICSLIEAIAWCGAMGENREGFAEIRLR